MLVLLNKPYQMLSQFNPNPDYPQHRTLTDLDLPRELNPIGRLDYDSEGLLLLSDDPRVEKSLLNPKKKHPRTYVVQIEGKPTNEALIQVRSGGLEIRINKKIHSCAPAKIKLLPERPEWLWERSPPVDRHSEKESHWIEVILTEGKNRQIRRVTSKIGHPTLRLIRHSIITSSIEALKPGQWSISS